MNLAVILAVGHRQFADLGAGGNSTYFIVVMPAKAGIQRLSLLPNLLKSLDSRFRGNDEPRHFGLK